MKRLELTNGGYSLVDPDIFEQIKLHKWHWVRGKYTKYVKRVIYPGGRRGGPTTIMLHWLVLGFPDSQYVDHKNGDGLDNRRENLRACNGSQNGQNKRTQKNNACGVKGVCELKRGARGKPPGLNARKWRATINVGGRQIYLGTFFDKRTAALAYNTAAQKHFGEFAWLNDLRGVLP